MITVIPKVKGFQIVDKNGNKPFTVTDIFSFYGAYPHLKKQSIIIGMIGSRGGGKSVGAARIAIIDFMLRGRTVWSNMDIGFNFQHKGKVKQFRSICIDKLALGDLDKVYENGLLVVDEVNAYIADSRRSMSSETLAFSYILQQIRKRRLNIIWTAQSEAHCDERLRWQTDIYIKCEDFKRLYSSAKNLEEGEKSHWVCIDYSGLITGQIRQNSIFRVIDIWNRPWWNAFNTYQLQGLEEVDDSLEQTANKIAEKVQEKGKISIPYIYSSFGIFDRKISEVLIMLLKKRGIIKDAGGRNFMTLAEYETAEAD